LIIQLTRKRKPALEKGEKVSFTLRSGTFNRHGWAPCCLASLPKKYGHEGFADDTIHIHYLGTAGQSAGAFSGARHYA